MKKLKIILMCMAIFAVIMSGCGSTGDNTDENDGAEEETSGDSYEDYIHDALQAVRDNAQVSDNAVNSDENGETDADTVDSNSNGRVIEIEKTDSSNETEPVYVSSEVADTDTGTSDDASDSDEKKTTPATFDVGTGLVYIDGKYDETYRTNLLTTINEARTGLNYPAMTINTSLNTCADLRAKEITCYLSHMRPDGSMFYSLAPDYYKAEIITIDSADPKETLDAWMTDPISRNILFSKDFTSIGASNYICNGLNCIVVSFGY